MIVIEISSVATLHLLKELLSDFIVIVNATWTQSRGYSLCCEFLEVLEESKISYAFQIVSCGGDELEEYVINDVQGSELPCVLHCAASKKDYTLIRSVSTLRDVIGTLAADCLKYTGQPDIIRQIFDSTSNEESIGTLFIAGDKSSVGKSSTCLAILASFLHLGVQADGLAYIKPATQCEAEQSVSKFCTKKGIDNCGIGPVVFYKGFTRAFLEGDTEPSSVLVENARQSVIDIGVGKKLTIVDGVGYPAVGSICGISNAHIARALNAPILLIGKSGVGDAVDSYNLNATYFEHHGVRVLGAIFNKLALDGFYSLESCRSAVSLYFNHYRTEHSLYGFVPMLQFKTDSGEGTSIDDSDDRINALVHAFTTYVNLPHLIFDIWKHKLLSAGIDSGLLRDRVATALRLRRYTIGEEAEFYMNGNDAKMPFPVHQSQSINVSVPTSRLNGGVVSAAASANIGFHVASRSGFSPSVGMSVDSTTTHPPNVNNKLSVDKKTMKRSRAEIEAEARKKGASGG
jgi:dethiobiotin synthetase